MQARKYIKLLENNFFLIKCNSFNFARAVQSSKILSNVSKKPNLNFHKNMNEDVFVNPSNKKEELEKDLLKKTNTLKEKKEIPFKTKEKISSSETIEGNKKEKNINENKNFQSTEKLCEAFKQNKEILDTTMVLKFLNDVVNNEKMKSKKNKKDINTKKSIYSDLLEINEVKEAIEYLKSQIYVMENKEFSNFMALLSKMNHYDSDLISNISSNVIEKKMNLSTVSISYIFWSLAKFRIKNESLIDFLKVTLLDQSKVAISGNNFNLFLENQSEKPSEHFLVFKFVGI